MWLAQLSAAEPRSNVDLKPIRHCRHSTPRIVPRGWMPENHPSLRPGVKYFLLTSPSIEPGRPDHRHDVNDLFSLIG